MRQKQKAAAIPFEVIIKLRKQLERRQKERERERGIDRSCEQACVMEAGVRPINSAETVSDVRRLWLTEGGQADITGTCADENMSAGGPVAP